VWPIGAWHSGLLQGESSESELVLIGTQGQVQGAVGGPGGNGMPQRCQQGPGRKSTGCHSFHRLVSPRSANGVVCVCWPGSWDL
jgi:hypothetical protein